MIGEKLIYDVVVGYMLKVIKSGVVITKYQNEFNAIKHGDYAEFIKLINVGYPNDVMVLKEGEIVSSQNQIDMKNADFLLLILSSAALKIFFDKCRIEYGNFNDADLSDEDFERLANFEMVLRMFVNTTFIIEDRINLVDVIKLLGNDLSIPESEISIIQKGRVFLNMVKQHRTNFSSYAEGLTAFSNALDILKKYDIVLDV